MKGFILGTIGACFAVPALGLAGAGVGVALHTHHTQQGLGHVSGTVVAVNTDAGPVTFAGAADAGSPVVAYTVAGHAYRWTDPRASSPVSPDVGQSVALTYPAGHPDRARRADAHPYAAALILGIVAIVAAGVGLPFLWLGLGRWLIRRRLLRTGRNATGTVTKIGWDNRFYAWGPGLSDPMGFDSHPCVVTASWVDPAGRSRTVSIDSLRSPVVKVGDRVTIRYAARRPRRCTIDPSTVFAPRGGRSAARHQQLNGDPTS